MPVCLAELKWIRSAVQGESKNGVLNVHLPKSATAKPKAIAVKVS